jgi:hypothetical protein
MPVTPMTIDLHHGAGDAAGDAKAAAPTAKQDEGRARWWWARGGRGSEAGGSGGGEALDALLGERPLVTLAFSDMVVRSHRGRCLRGGLLGQAAVGGVLSRAHLPSPACPPTWPPPRPPP